MNILDILVSKDTDDILVESDSHDVLSNLSKSYYDNLSSKHHKWITRQKNLFTQLKYDDADENTYRILTNKYDKETNEPFAVFMSAVRKIAKYQLDHDHDDRKRISTIKAFLNYHPGLCNLTQRSIDDIGYEFNFSYIPIDSLEKVFNSFKDHFQKYTPISFKEALLLLPKDYRDYGTMKDKLDDSMKVIIDKDKNYRIEDIVDKYDDIINKRSTFTKNNIDKFNDVHESIFTLRNSAKDVWVSNTKRIKNMDISEEQKSIYYKNNMNSMMVLNQLIEFVNDGCYELMRVMLYHIADSDRASEVLTKQMITKIIDRVPLARGE